MLKLYGYYRSSAAFRVRIALNYKKLPYIQESVHLVQGGGEQFSQHYRAINPQSLVPALDHDGHLITQSIAIIEYLEEIHPKPALLPQNSYDRAKIRSIAQLIACDIHPLNNLRVLKYLQSTLEVTEAGKLAWYQHWIHAGLLPLEICLVKDPQRGKCCFGNEPTLADILLIPQIANAKRFNCSLEDYPTLVAIYEHCMQLPYFASAAPDKQPDAE